MVGYTLDADVLPVSNCARPIRLSELFRAALRSNPVESVPAWLNSVRQIQQYSVGIGDGVLAELAAFQIFLAHLAVPPNGNFSCAGIGLGSGERFKILFSFLQVVNLKTKMIQAGHQTAVGHHVPGANCQTHLAVAQIVAVIAGHAFHWPQVENLLVVLGNIGGPAAADADMVDPTRLFPAEFDIAFANIVHAFLREIELIAVGGAAS